MVDAQIRFAALSFPDKKLVHEPPHFRIEEDEVCYLKSPNGVRFRIERGEVITVDTSNVANDDEVYGWLYGPAFSLLFHQRGRPLMHAGAVAIGQGVVAMAGDKGAGKSTTVAALLRRGHRLMSDDQALIDADTAVIYPYIPVLKLWEKTAIALGEDLHSITQVRPDIDKCVFDARSRFQTSSAYLSAIMLLSTNQDLQHPRALRLSAAAAVPQLHRNVFRVHLAELMGLAPNLFRWAAGVAANVPVYQLERPNDLSAVDELAELIESITLKHAREGINAAATQLDSTQSPVTERLTQ
jgi:hypothetical protein